MLENNGFSGDALKDLIDKPKELKTRFDDHSKSIAQILSDEKYNENYKAQLVKEAEEVYTAEIKSYVSDFDQMVQNKRKMLEIQADPPPEAKAVEPMPNTLMLDGDKAIWRNMSELKLVVGELVNGQRIELHREDINLMNAAEIIRAYNDESTGDTFREALETYGVRHVKRLASNGDKNAITAFQQLESAIQARKEAAKTPKMRRAEEDLDRLSKATSKFDMFLTELEKNRNRLKQNRPLEQLNGRR